MASQIFGLGTMYSQKHHDDLLQNNFKFIRHTWDCLTETKQNDLKLALKLLRVKEDDYKVDASDYLDQLKGCVSLVLVGTDAQKFTKISEILTNHEVPTELRHPFPTENEFIGNLV